MDIRKQAVQETGRFQVRDVNDVLIDGMYITVYSPGSKQYARANAERQNAMLEKARAKGKINQTAEQRAAENAKFLTACTVSFEGIEYDDLAGNELFEAVYSDLTIGFIADQVASFVGDWANFTKASASN